MWLLLIIAISLSVATGLAIGLLVRIYIVKFHISGTRRGLERQLNHRCRLVSGLVLMVQQRIRARRELTSELIIMMGRVLGAESFQRRIEIEDELTVKLNDFIEFLEGYPDIKRNPVLIQFEKDLVLEKEKIYSSIYDYNEHIKRFNMMTGRFPYYFLTGTTINTSLNTA